LHIAMLSPRRHPPVLLNSSLFQQAIQNHNIARPVFAPLEMLHIKQKPLCQSPEDDPHIFEQTVPPLGGPHRDPLPCRPSCLQRPPSCPLLLAPECSKGLLSSNRGLHYRRH